MIIKIIGLVLLLIVIGMLLAVLIKQHQLKKLQKQNQAIDYIIERMKQNTNKETEQRLDELIHIVREK